ncbi:hypothetical protein ABPG72_009126 [Tetrahymena utriculariae]
MTVRQRLIAQQSDCVRFYMIILIKSLSNLLTKNTVGDLNNEEESERIKIGTEVGKFHQRALAMREKSIFSLENMKDVFLQEDIVEGLNERSDGSMINPDHVQILDIARINANMDTISIQNTPNKELNLNVSFYIGAEYGTRSYFEENYDYKPLKWTQYQPNKQVTKDLNETQLFYYKSEQLKEKIDAVVPLFDLKDYDLKPLLKTQFFHVLMKFNVMHNVDTQQSTQIAELMDKIYHSIKIVDGDRPFFKTYCQMLINLPRQAMVTYHERDPTYFQDPSKALIVLFFLYKNGQLKDNFKIKEIQEAILQKIVCRGTKSLEKLHTYRV